MKVYVASSWRNSFQNSIVELLRLHGLEVYDFKNPEPDNNGFSWATIDSGWMSWSFDEYINALQHDDANHGFKLDFDAMKNADACVLVLPSGRSAHIEAGYFVGAGKKLIIYYPLDQEPELMYKMADLITNNPFEIIKKLKDHPEGCTFPNCLCGPTPEAIVKGDYIKCEKIEDKEMVEFICKRENGLARCRAWCGKDKCRKEVGHE